MLAGIFLSLAVSVPSAREIAIEGQVTYTGPVPRGVDVAEAGTTRQRVQVDPKSKGLKDAVVWLEGVPRPARQRPPKQAVMDQQNFFFVPHVLVIEAGDTVQFLNSDSANHCVQAAAAEGKNAFNVITPPNQAYKHTFVKARHPIKISCSLHAGMLAWIVVLDHPYHAVTDKTGTFRLPAVPPGKYRLRVRHLEGGMDRTVAVEVKEKMGKLQIEFTKKDLDLD